MYKNLIRDGRSVNYQNWPVQAQATPRQPDRVWLDISDEEDGANLPQAPFKGPSSKTGSQITPPLDLSGNKKKTRQPESPLDLSVKTRKRHADTTDLEEVEVRAGQMPDAFSAKRMCVSQMDYLQGRRYSQEDKISHAGHGQVGIDAKHLMGESMIRNNLMHGQHQEKYQTLQKRNSPIAQTSPLAIAQQQFSSMQRKHSLASHSSRSVSLQQGIYPIGFEHQRSQQQLHTQPTSQPQTKSLQKEHMMQLKKQMPYDSLSSPLSRSASANSTESVALQGFFEPTCKLTVNNIAPVTEYQSRMPNKANVDQMMMHSPNQTLFPLSRSRELPSANDQRTQHIYMHASSYPQSSAGKTGRMEVSPRPSQTTNELELIQQKQLEQRQLQQLQQAQRVDHMTDKMAFMTQMNQQKNLMLPDRQKMTMKQTDPASVQMSSQNKSSLSAYSQKLHATYTQGTSHISSRSDEPGFGSGRYIRASQPVPLSDISKHQGAQEQPQVIHNPHNIFSMQASVKGAASLGCRQTGTMASTANNHERSRQYQRQNSDRERRYHIAESAGRPIPHTERMNPVVSQSLYTHPSVIQRPAGFIEPRVVSGSGRQGYGQTNPPQVEKIAEQSLSAAGCMNRYGERRESLTIDHPFADRATQELSPVRLGYYDNRAKTRPISHELINTMVAESRQPLSREPHRSCSKEQFRMSNTDHRRRDQHSTGSSLQQRGMSRGNGHEHRFPAEQIQSREKNKRSHNTCASQPPPSQAVHTQSLANRVNASSSQRSITKGTSGISKSGQGLDLFSKLVLTELQKENDDNVVNPFHNVSLLKELDKSATSSPAKAEDDESKRKTETPNTKCRETRTPVTKNDTFKDPLPSPLTNTKQDSVSYTLPLQIAIPGSKPIVSSSRTSVISSTRQDSSALKTPKMMSRKHMILSAFKHDEDRKNSASIIQDEKIATSEQSQSATKRTDKDGNPSGPTSPKMPILSPQDRARPAPLVSPAIGEPPKLENPAASNANCAPNASSVPAKFSLEEHLHKLISDAVKVNKDKEAVYETVCRELTTQPQGPKVFLSRQLSQPRNIPVANVAPIVHGKVIQDTGEEEDKPVDQKLEHDLDEEDEKMAEIVTMSLLGRSFEKKQESVQEDVEKKLEEMKREDIKSILKDSVGECSNSSANFSNLTNENLYDENSNSKRMSPGLKKLMLYRHRDIAESSKDGVNSNNDVKSSPALDSKRSPDIEKEERNVFGAFSEILANKSGEDELNEDTCWSGLQQEDVEHQIHMVPNTDYDGDDEDCRLPQKFPRGRQSSVRQQADRLIKKAKHRRKSREGTLLRSRHLSTRRSSQRGFVDFKPQVLPRRTRSRLKGKSPTSRKSRVSKSETSPVRQSRRKSSQESRTRQRRASSLDRETNAGKSRTKSKSSCFSDNELEHVDNTARVPEDQTDSRPTPWHHDDESTDEEYFQKYENKFKKLSRRKSGELVLKKTPGPKRKRGFHFQQKYIFQRKRKSKGRGKYPTDVGHNFKENLDEIYSFHEEGPEPLPFVSGAPEYSNVPVPPEVKRISVNKDTGETLLHRAARMGYEEIALYCLATGTVDVNARDNTGYTALHECGVRGRVVIAKHLLKHGADVNCCSVDGIRPIHDAVENDQLEMVRILLSFGADPTLSTYAGRSLIKLARTDKMRRFLKAYVCDLNGHSSSSVDNLWQFKKSSVLLEREDDLGCAIFTHVPSDPEDEAGDMITANSKPLFTTRRLTMEPSKRIEDYILLGDILHSYHVTRVELDTLGLPSHLIKTVSAKGIKISHTDSIYREMFNKMDEQEQIPAVRLVDSTQLITKLEKPATSSSKRSKV